MGLYARLDHIEWLQQRAVRAEDFEVVYERASSQMQGARYTEYHAVSSLGIFEGVTSIMSDV